MKDQACRFTSTFFHLFSTVIFLPRKNFKVLINFSLRHLHLETIEWYEYPVSFFSLVLILHGERVFQTEMRVLTYSYAEDPLTSTHGLIVNVTHDQSIALIQDTGKLPDKSHEVPYKITPERSFTLHETREKLINETISAKGYPRRTFPQVFIFSNGQYFAHEP